MSRWTGFSLIEVLVALVILTVGLIGVFNLHLVAKRSSYESFQQTQASYLAADIISRMKLNTRELQAYAGSYSATQSMNASPPTNCDTNNCDNAAIRLWDLHQWQQALAGSQENIGGESVGGLNKSTGCIDIQNDGLVSVVISWQGLRKLSDAADSGSAFAKTCGIASKNRRIFSLSTVIL